MARERRINTLGGFGALLIALLLVIEFGSCLSMSLSGDDFELLALARIGGFSPQALLVPHRGVFLKPVMNAAWAGLVHLFGTRPSPWYAFGLAVHLLNAGLLGVLAARLSSQWAGAFPAPGEARSADPGSWGGGGQASGEDQAGAQAPSVGSRSAQSASWGVGSVGLGLATAAIWAVHDRLAEPVLSLSSLNHSLTFALYLLALLAVLKAVGSGSSRDRLLAALLMLPALFSYEVAVSLIPAAALLILLDPRGSLRERMGRFGLTLGVITLAYVSVQVLVRLAPGAMSYYRLSPATVAGNFSEGGLAFLHIQSGWVRPGLLPAIAIAAAFTAGLILVRDAIARFGLVWSLAAFLPIAPIPEISDRYHYITFAGLALAVARLSALAWARLGRSSGGAGVRTAIVAASMAIVFALHLGWSFAGSREQATYYRFKGLLPAALQGTARSAVEASDAGAAAVLILAWPDDPAYTARRIEAFESKPGSFRFGERSHPVYVRADAVLGAVYPADLFNVAGSERGEFYRAPEPAVVARAVAEGRVRVVAFAHSPAPGEDDEQFQVLVAATLREAILARHEVPLALPLLGISMRTPLRLAYLERTDRAGAFAAEYSQTDRTTTSRVEESR